MDTMTRGSAGLAQYIDHTLLRPDAAQKDFEKLFTEAIAYQFYSVCIPPSRVSLAQKHLKDSSVKICTVVGFPFGYTSVAAKAFEVRTAIEQGAHEIDMVLHISALKSGDRNGVLEDIRSVVRSAAGRPVKVIFETCYLTEEEKRLACQLSMDAGAQFVKTSTGFGSAGATEEDVRLMVELVSPKLGVKASGGIRDYDTAKKFIDLGATRLGTSHGVAIVHHGGATSTGAY